MHKPSLTVLFLGIVLCSAARGQDVVVIVNNAVKATNASSYDIHSVFTGEKSSLADGSHVTPVTLKAGAAHEAFLKAYVGKGDAAFRTSWRSLVFTGQGSMPKTFDSEPALVDYVAATPGAIGYVGNGIAHDKVKTLAVK
jgi:ABC-type phosphate transport system substrate-binding protein